MAGEWKKMILGELVESGDAHLQTGPFGTALKAAEYSDDGVPLISVGEVRQGHFEVSATTPRISVETAKRLPKFVLEIGDIVFGRKGGIDRNAIVKAPQQGWFLGSDGIRLRLSPKNSGLFLSYQMRSPATRAWLLQNCEGTTMPSLNQEILGRVPIVLPPLPEQKAIAAVLGALDDKIELNRRMNATLESMARALFQSWFVDFDPVRAKLDDRTPEGMDKSTAALFPSSFQDSPLGPIPKGWTTLPLYDLATYVNGAAYTAFQPNNDCRGLPIIKIAELKAGVTDQTKFSDVPMPEKYRLQTGDILFSWSGNPDTSIDTFVWSHGPAWLNQHIFLVAPHRDEERTFVLATLKYLRPVFAEIARNKQTTGLGHVTAGDMQRLFVIKPDPRILTAWDYHANPILEAIFRNTLESQTLATLRDTLLPKLLSGELPVSSIRHQQRGEA